MVVGRNQTDAYNTSDTRLVSAPKRFKTYLHLSRILRALNPRPPRVDARQAGQ